MLGIEMSDVIAVLASIRPQLIIIGIVLLLAIIVTIAVRKLSMPKRKFARAETWIATVLVVSVAVTSMLYGGVRNLLDLSFGSGALTEETLEQAADVANTVSDEGMVLLKNESGALPLPVDPKVNVFGWASTSPVYGGSGSGSLSDAYEFTTLLDGLANAGIEVNTELTDFYTEYASERPSIGFSLTAADWTLPEPPVDTYPESLIEGAKEFSDTAIVVISRIGGEGMDLPTDVNTIAADGENVYTENAEGRTDFEDGEGILQLSRSERDMIELAKSTSENVILVYNGANAFELGELNDDPDVDSIVWAIPPGQIGFDALGRILAGEVNPSGKSPDTFVYDLTATPSANNFGGFTYTNMDEFTVDASQTLLPFVNHVEGIPTFVNYVEGIYVGYRFYETADAEGLIDYDSTVVYPFGHGLSYTTFSQEMGDASVADGTVSFDVTVTNTGSTPGKDVVQAYYTPPYETGGIEKSAVNFVAYEKTDVLQPGESQTLELSFALDDMASYDTSGGGAYVLEAGDYTISIRSDSHTVLADQDISINEEVRYDSEGNTHGDDQVPATNQFDSAHGAGFTYLSRTDGFANYEEATAEPSSYEMPDDLKEMFIVTDNYDPAEHNDDSDEMPTTGAKNGLVLGDLVGVDYDDPRWDELLDQMTIDDMNSLIANGGYQTSAVKSVGKVQTIDVDGPAALNNNFTKVGSFGLPVSVSVAATFNKQLAYDFGAVIGKMGAEMEVSGWYAPAVNIHRDAYAGRNFEYFSEDPVLAGEQAAEEILGASESGIYAFIKHFALNDQETNRNSMLATWTDEQAMREIYLRPFEIAVKDGKSGAVMSSFNYIGPVYAGASPELLKTVLRDEWGFHGMVLTDYFGGYGYQNADQIVRGGGDAMLATIDMGVNTVQDKSATSVKEMRRAAKSILYTTANSRVYADGQPETKRVAWEYIVWGAWAVIGASLIAAEVVTIRRYRARLAEEQVVTVEAVVS